MPQGLLMFDGNKRLILWNKRYEEIYSLQNRMKAGMTLAEVMKGRVAAGTLAENPLEHAHRAEAAADSGQELEYVFHLPNGKVVLGSNRPRADGGWVSTHEDVTDRKSFEMQRAAIEREQARRESIGSAIERFSQSTSSLLTQVNESMASMCHTAGRLLQTSNNTSRRVSSTTQSFEEASENINAVASATQQLSSSINSLNAQLGQTTQTAPAATRHVREAQNSTGLAIDTIQRIYGRMQEINASASTAATAVAQQSLATDEISQNISAAAKGASDVSVVLGEASVAVLDAQSSAEIVLQASQAVEGRVTELRARVEEFLTSVAA